MLAQRDAMVIQNKSLTTNSVPVNQNNHPTVKPIELMKYLIKLITPPGGTVLDPFTGSGSTGCAAVELGHPFVGCELDPRYVEIARKRIEAWQQQHLDHSTFNKLFSIED
jgi:DNA modification methylase